MDELDPFLETLFSRAPYANSPEQTEAILLPWLRELTLHAASRHPGLARIVHDWPIPVEEATRISDLPFLHVSAFKSDPPLALVPTGSIRRVVRSSSTSGQAPSQVALDTATSRRMVKGVASIFKDLLGNERRPYLVFDAPPGTKGSDSMGASAAAAASLQPFASATFHAFKTVDGALAIDPESIEAFTNATGSKPSVAYGFTTRIWSDFVTGTRKQGLRWNIPDLRIFHSGGWKKLVDERVEKTIFDAEISDILGCPKENVTDYYGMAENIGVIYPDCREGLKHVPGFASIVVRDPANLEPVGAGGTGVFQACSILPTSFPGHLILTDDLVELVVEDGCPCGRRGPGFRFAGRIPKSESRGCGIVGARDRRTA